MAHQARKRFGQNFLVDASIPQAIVRSVAPDRGDLVVEIGPGLSALTTPLLACLDHLHVVEIDRDLARRLQHQHSPQRLTVHQDDALNVDFTQFGKQLRVVGNLPYNISSPLLFHLLTAVEHVRDQHFMLQKEVVDRMVATPGSTNYGRLSVMLQLHYRMTHLFDVPPESFNPPPKVMSAVVRMVPLGADRPRPKNQTLFAVLVAQAFSQRRKMLRTVLKDRQIDWATVGIDPTQRPQDLSVAQYIALADHCA